MSLKDLSTGLTKKVDPSDSRFWSVNPDAPANYESLAGGNVEPYRPAEPAAPSVVYNPDGTRSEVDKYWENNKPLSAEQYKTQDQTTKDDYARKMQGAISSIDNMYVSILQRANQQGANRLGSANVMNALSGQRGSASGAANVADAEQANLNDIRGIENEKLAKIEGIRGNYNKDLQEELRYQNGLRESNTDKWLEYMSGAEDKKKLKSKEMRTQLIGANIKITDIPEDQLAEMAESAGYSVDQFKLLYETERKQNERAFADEELAKLAKLEKDEAELAKTKAETEKLQNEGQLTEKDLLNKGYVYVSTPAERDKLKAQGYVMIQLNGRTYAKPGELSTYEAKKQIDAKYKKSSGGNNVSNNYDTAKAELESTKGDGKKDTYWNTDVYKRLRSQAKDKSSFDKTFGYNLNPNDTGAKPFIPAITLKTETDKYNFSNIPTDIYQEIIDNAKAGADYTSLLSAYSDVDPELIKKILSE